jgi:hypothetical protein
MEQIDLDEKARLSNKRTTLSVRLNSKQMSALSKIYWGNQQPHSSLSGIVREAVCEHLKNRYGINIEPHLDFVDE